MNRRAFLQTASLATVGFFTPACRGRTSLAGLSRPTIDLHVHAAALGGEVPGAYLSAHFQQSRTFKIYMWAAGVSAEDLAGKVGTQRYLDNLLAQIRGAPSVSKAVVLAMDQVYDQRGKAQRDRTEFHIPNDFVIDLARRHPSLLAGISLHPDRPGAVEELTRLRAAGAVLLKWLPNTQNIQLGARRHIPFYREMARLKLPLLVHMGEEQAVPVIDQTLADPLNLRLPLEQGVRVICAHCASLGESQGQSNFDRFLSLLPEFENLYGGLSAVTQFNRRSALERLIDRGDLWSRMVHGSDYPLPFFPLSSPYWFAGRLPRSQLDALQAIVNRLEREIRLKLALGVPQSVFDRWRVLLA